MKVVCVALIALCSSSVFAARFTDADKSASVNKVVKMLQDMLKQSQDDWKSDKAAYEKFATYCSTNTDTKTTAIADATTAIGLLSNKIDAIQGSNGALSIQTAQLDADMAENVQARADAKNLRAKENKAFLAEEADLKAAIGQMDEAVKTLAAIGADQTMASGADHAKFMGKYNKKSLVSIQSSVKRALSAASAFVEPAKKAEVLTLLQAPFTGAYAAQSGQIVGILKDMADTFKSNLESAQATEAASNSAYEGFKKNKEEEHADLKKSYDEKQATLGTNDGDLSTKKTQLQTTKKEKGEDEDFLSKLTVQCTDKKEQYEARKLFAANEDVALSKAVSILDNGVAAEKFGAQKATSNGKTGFFLQLSSETDRRNEAVELLQKAVAEQHSAHLIKVLTLIQSGNPFTVILQQIDDMVKLADDEQTVDNEEKAWCEKTNKKNSDTLDDTKDNLNKVRDDITKLKAKLNDPKTGLKKQLADVTESLKTNLKNQGAESQTRREDNVEYQKDVSNMQSSIDIITKAENVLSKYYDALDNEQIGLVQRDPKPPATFEGKYKGQNEGAKKVLGMLEFIKSETVKEEHTRHDDELKGQHDYEDSMKALTDSEAAAQETIVKLNKDISGAEKDLLATIEDETNTEQEKIAQERYIEKIKPGCDFIQNNFDVRKKSRAAEKTALTGAKTKLKGSPAFKAAQQKAKEDAFGRCKATCVKDEAHVKCKACMAGTSVPGYCAGHKGTPGC